MTMRLVGLSATKPFALDEFCADPMRVRTIELDPDERERVPIEAYCNGNIVVVRWRGFTAIAYGPEKQSLLRLA